MSRFSGDQLGKPVFTLGFVLLLTSILFAPSLNAQLFRGFISGTVTDPQNLVMVGVQVTITNQATGIATTAPTNEVGFYRFAAVEPGSYSVEFRIEGFENQRVENVTVSASQERVINATLRPGAVATEITVTAVGVELTKTNPNIDQILSERVVLALPIAQNRDITKFSVLAPTATRAPGQNEVGINGQRPRNTNFTIDGVDNNDNTVTQPSIQTPPEAIKEFQVQVATFSAEFGRNTGGQVNVITKTGGNEFHGEVWDYYSSNWLEPLSLTNQRANLTRNPWFLQNQFGGDIGGPIVRNRTFFFGLLQGTIRREKPGTAGATSANIPTPAGYSLLQAVPLRAGQSAQSRQDVLKALSFLPEIHSEVQNYDNIRTVLVNGVPIEVGTIRFLIDQPQNDWYSIGRVDHNMSDRDRLSYRYHLDYRDQPNRNSNLQFGPRWAASTQNKGQNHTLMYTGIFSPRFISEARVGYNRRNLDFPENDPVSPTINLTGLFTIGGTNAFPQKRVDELYQVQNVNTYIAGRHSLKFGVDLRYNILFSRAGTNSKGTWAFSTLENFLNNTAVSLTQTVSEAMTFKLKQWHQYYFFQDDLKVTPNFTLNLGVRYENSTVPFGFFGATDPAVRAVGVPGPAKRDNNNWAPRVGFAYSPTGLDGFWGSLLGDGETSIRGGFGMSYDVIFHNVILNTSITAYPRAITQTDANLVDVFPTLRPKVATAPPLNALSTFINVPEDIQNPTTHYWTLSVQRQLGNNYIAEVGYTGNRSYHMLRQNQANIGVVTPEQAAQVIATGDPNAAGSLQSRRLNPSIGSRMIIEATGKGEYHAAYVRFDKKFSHGLQMSANYTWSANLSDSEEVNLDTSLRVPIATSSPQTAQDFRNLRNEWSRSVFDRPHRFAVHYVYDIPWFSNSAEALRHVFGGWQIGGLTEYQSGQPFTIRVGVDTLGNANSSSIPPGRPNYNPSGIIEKDPVTNDLRTFRIPLDGTGIVTAPRTASGFLANSMPFGGNLGRNTFRGPSYHNWNLFLMKSIDIHEGWRLQLKGDFINAFNHRNFQNPDPVMQSPTFGANTATPITDNRQVLLSARIVF